nr:hypothetical protein [Rickettsia endosymbiont of Ceutorhynchus assimilis]
MSECITGGECRDQSFCIRQAVCLLRTRLESDMYFLLRELFELGKKPSNGFSWMQDVEKHENGVNCCNLYLYNSISLDDLCVLMNKYGLHEQLKQHVAKYMCEDMILKYIGYDEVD